MLEGGSIRKLVSGTSSQANQKVPTGLDALVLVSEMLYWNKPGPSWSVVIVADTVSLIGRRAACWFGARRVRRKAGLQPVIYHRRSLPRSCGKNRRGCEARL